ncbi:hypothetical protein AHAS_Ahas16G0112500 [Arachis hypogaea]
MWELLHNISRNMNLPWLMIGDFNDIAEQSEKKGGGGNDAHACRRYSGSRFTWKGGIREGQERVYKRLDRALCNSEWRTNFPNAFVEVLPRIQSDHHPLLLHTRPDNSTQGKRPFRRKNKIVKLRNNNGIWCEEVEAVKSIVSNFFTDLYRDERPEHPTIRCNWQYKRLEEEQKQMLERMPIPSEIEEAIHNIGSLKAPGEDGYHVLFFKENWKVLQCSICAFIQKLWQDPPPQYNRIQPTLNERIAPNQSSLIPSRLIHDNIIIAKEMRTKARGSSVPLPFRHRHGQALTIHRRDHYKGKVDTNGSGQRGPQISHLLFADDLLLFVEATKNQMKVVLETLDEFGAASGFKINTEKTSILLSKNVPNCKRVGIKEICGFQEVPCLERYLGAYLTNNRKKKEDFKSIIERTKSKLKGWKANCLSLARRITLAQTVINPMLNFDMLHTKIPIGICKEVEKC